MFPLEGQFKPKHLFSGIQPPWVRRCKTWNGWLSLAFLKESWRAKAGSAPLRSWILERLVFVYVLEVNAKTWDF